nr:PREDICTED: uncharacterized protein LOC108218160 isoform X2 [Daucus carota subsp. sativus]
MKAVDDYYVQVVADTCKNSSAASLVVEGESSSSSVSRSFDHNRIKCNSWKTRYKFWAPLTIILLLALCSMFTGSVTLHWSTAAAALPDDLDYPLHSDLDILEVEERVKMVRRMWNVYTHSNTIKLPRFWQRAFQAAYEDLTSHVSSLRNNALLEIAQMSMFSLQSLPQPALPLETQRRKETVASKLQKPRRRLLHVGE